MRGKKARKLLGVLFLLMICGFFASKKVDAMTYSSKLQTGQTQNSITVSWKTSESKVTGYKLYFGKDYSDASKKKPIALSGSASSYTFSKLAAGTEYYVRIEYTYISSYSGSSYTNTLNSAYMATLPGKVQGVKQERWYRYAQSVDAVWTKQDGVSGYEYVIRDSKNRIKKSDKSTYGTWITCPIRNNMLYTMTVRAYTDINGRRYYGQWSDRAYLFTQPEVSKLSIKNGKLTVKWKKISGVTGYDVYVSTKQNTGYKKVKAVSAKKASATISKLKKKKFNKKKTYYVYVAAKKKVGKRVYDSGVNYLSIIKKGRFNSHSLNYIS